MNCCFIHFFGDVAGERFRGFEGLANGTLERSFKTECCGLSGFKNKMLWPEWLVGARQAVARVAPGHVLGVVKSGRSAGERFRGFEAWQTAGCGARGSCREGWAVYQSASRGPSGAGRRSGGFEGWRAVSLNAR